MGQIKKLGEMGVRITCSCGNLHELERGEDGSLTYDEIFVRKEKPVAPIAAEEGEEGKIVPPAKEDKKTKTRYIGLFKVEGKG